jgi:hypothetical protein
MAREEEDAASGAEEEVTGDAVAAAEEGIGKPRHTRVIEEVSMLEEQAFQNSELPVLSRMWQRPTVEDPDTLHCKQS